jgi:hypothetical protein
MSWKNILKVDLDEEVGITEGHTRRDYTVWEAFNKWGFGDGDDRDISLAIADAIEERGYEVGITDAWTHNTYINSIRKRKTERERGEYIWSIREDGKFSDPLELIKERDPALFKFIETEGKEIIEDFFEGDLE